jgi:hypothetical protein
VKIEGTRADHQVRSDAARGVGPMTSNPGLPCLPLPLRAIVTPVPLTALATTGAVPKQARSNLAIYDPCPALSKYHKGLLRAGFPPRRACAASLPLMKVAPARTGPTR